MVKVSKVFLSDILPSTGTALLVNAVVDLQTGIVFYEVDGKCKATHVSRVREMTFDDVACHPYGKLVESTPAPAPIVRKGPTRK